MQIARHYWLKVGRPRKYKVIALTSATTARRSRRSTSAAARHGASPYEPLAGRGFRKVAGALPDVGPRRRDRRRPGAPLRRPAGRADPRGGPGDGGRRDPGAVPLLGGCIIPPLGWLERVRDICDELEVLMIADEVITGFGRTGRWFGVDHESVVPDLMSVAKGITSGYIPLSASIARAEARGAFPEDSREENVHPNTYCGHPVACAAALANLAILERENLVENAAAWASACSGDRGARARSADRGRGALARPDARDRFYRPRAGATGRSTAPAWRVLNTRALDKGYIADGEGQRAAARSHRARAKWTSSRSSRSRSLRELQDEVTRSARGRVAA